MSEVSAPVDKDDPLMIAWEAYRASPEYDNTRRWALNLNFIRDNPQSVDGNLWAAFVAGYTAGGGSRDSANG